MKHPAMQHTAPTAALLAWLCCTLVCCQAAQRAAVTGTHQVSDMVLNGDEGIITAVRPSSMRALQQVQVVQPGGGTGGSTAGGTGAGSSTGDGTGVVVINPTDDSW